MRGYFGIRLNSLVFGWKEHSFIDSMSCLRRIFSMFYRLFSFSLLRRSWIGVRDLATEAERAERGIGGP